MMSVIMLNVIMLNAILLSFVMLNVMAPIEGKEGFFQFLLMR
jgi:hypothetical protein